MSDGRSEERCPSPASRLLRLLGDPDDNDAMIPFPGIREPHRARIRPDTSDEDVASFASALGVPAWHVRCSAFAYTVSRFACGKDAVVRFEVGNGSVPVRIQCSDVPAEEFVAEASRRISETEELASCPDADLSRLPFRDSAPLFSRGGAPCPAARFQMYTDGNGPVFCSSEGFDEDLLGRFAFAFDRVLGGICERARMGSIAYVSEEDVILQERINDT